MSELPPEIVEQVDALRIQAGALIVDSRFREALDHFEVAWLLLPKPRTDWELAGRLLVEYGDAYFRAGDFQHGRDKFLLAMQCPETMPDPFLHLRLGQCHFELGDLTGAGEELSRALLYGGSELFRYEKVCYSDYVKTFLEEE